MNAEDKFQHSRKKMRAVADMLDILSRFEDLNDRRSLLVTLVTMSDERAEQLVDAEMRKMYKDGKP